MLELILVRHGETDGNIKLTALGTTDLPLNDRGVRQAQTLARVFALEKPDAIYASPLKRARSTADIINERHGITIVPMLDLCERNFGIWENLAVTDIRVRYEAEYAAWQQDLADYVIPDGESARQAYDRNIRAIEELIQKHPQGKIIVVTHLGVIRNILSYLMGMGISGAWHFQANTGSICRLKVDENGFAVLTSFNEF